MKKLIYVGALDHNATIRVEGKLQDLRLTAGQEYDLPQDHPHIAQLIAVGLLVEPDKSKSKQK